MRRLISWRYVPLHVLVCVALTLAGGFARGEERLKVSTDNACETEIKDRIASVAKAVNDEDVDAYVRCFPASQHTRRRREAGLLFVQHQVGMELLETHFVLKDKERCEVAVRYHLLHDAKPTEIVATVTLMKSGEGWLVTKEKVLSAVNGSEQEVIRVADLHRHEDRMNLFRPFDGDFRVAPGGCANGRCGQ